MWYVPRRASGPRPSAAPSGAAGYGFSSACRRAPRLVAVWTSLRCVVRGRLHTPMRCVEGCPREGPGVCI